MIFAGSCQQENLEPVAQGNTVTYTVELPDVQTKAIGDANTVDQLIYEVWKTEKADERDLTDETKAIRLYQENTALIERNGKTCAVITLNLVQDQEYTILFWAQKKGTGVYNTDYLTNVHYAKSPKTELFSNQENYAAFYATDFVSDSDPKSKTVILKRPFAQLNLATKNTADEYGVVVESSKVIVTKVGSHFNVATNIAETPGNPGVNSVTEPLEFVFNTANDPSGEDEYITVNGQQYEYVAMNYMFATGQTVTVQYEINTILTGTNGQAATAKVTNQVLNVPLKENYRTNIVGNLLTSTTDYEVVIDASWDDQGDGTLVEVGDSKYAQEPYFNEETKQYEISLASELVWLAHKVNGTLENPAAETKTVGYYEPETFEGKTFVLKEDIDLKNVLWTPIGATGKFMGTFDGNAKTIKNLNVKVSDKTPAGLFANAKYVKNVTVENAVVEGHYKVGVIVGDGLCSRIKDCHVKNATVTATTLNNDEGNNVGGIVGYLSSEHDAYVMGCTVENATIKAYRDVGGIVGNANDGDINPAVVSGNTVKDVTVIADQTPAYYTSKAANVGTIVGRDNKTGRTVIESNVVENSTAVVWVNTAANLQYQANNNTGTIEIVFASDITGNVTVDQQENKNVVINGNGKKFDGTITIDGNSRNNGAETLSIKNVNFETESADVYFLEMNSTDGALRYAHNVTVENCTFKGNETTVGARFRQCYNITFKNSEVISGHSLAQLYGCTGVTVDGVTVNAKGGVSFGTSTNVTAKNSTFNVQDYAVRADASVETTLNIENITATAKLPVVVRYYTNAGYQVSFTGENTLTAPGYQVVLTAGKDDAVFVAPAAHTIIGADDFCVFPVADYFYAYNRADLEYLLANAAEGETEIRLADNIVGDVTVVQKPGVKITIEGEGHKFNGSIKVHSNSNYYADAALTVKNVNFETSAASVNVIEALENGSQRYSQNITVDNCTFTATGEAVNTSVAVQVKATRGVTVTGCTATNMHSLIQAQSCDTGDVKVVNCTVNGKNGVAFKQVKSATVEGTTITALEYGIRFDGNIDNYGIVVKNNNVTAVQPFIVRKMTGKNNTIALEGENTLTTEAEYQVVITNGSDDEEYVKPTGTYTLTGADNYTIFPEPFPVASWDEFTAALAAGEENIKLTADITYDANYQLQKSVTLNLGGYSMTLPMINIHTKTTIKNGTINGKVYARKNSEIVFNKVTFSGAVADNLSTEGHLAIQGGCKSLYAKDCLFSPTSVSGSQTKPLSFEGGSTIMKFENCEFKSSPYKKQVYLNSLSATGSLDFTNCNFNNKTPNIMFAAACPLTNVTMSGTTKLSSVTFEINRAKDAVTDADLAYLRTLIANNSFSSVRVFYAGGSSEYIR